MKDGGMAFPFSASRSCDEQFTATGMSLRDYFAAKAMQGYVSCEVASMTQKEYAKVAYEIADAMLAERDK